MPTQLKLVHDMLEVYDKKAKPTWNNEKPINVTFSMDLYQILELVSYIYFDFLKNFHGKIHRSNFRTDHYPRRYSYSLVIIPNSVIFSLFLFISLIFSFFQY